MILTSKGEVYCCQDKQSLFDIKKKYPNKLVYSPSYYWIVDEPNLMFKEKHSLEVIDFLSIS